MANTLHYTDYHKSDLLETEPREISLELEVSKVTIRVILIMAALVGVWGFACLFGGIIASQGATDFVQGWLSAVTGV